jgi:hypothetical protein
MFKWLMKLFKKKESNHPLTHLPSFFIEVNPDNGDILVSSSWATPTNEDELASVVKGMTGLLILLNNGKLTPIFQHAVSIYGENHEERHTAHAILASFQQHAGIIDTAPEKKPIVQPINAFNRG